MFCLDWIDWWSDSHVEVALLELINDGTALLVHQKQRTRELLAQRHSHGALHRRRHVRLVPALWGRHRVVYRVERNVPSMIGQKRARTHGRDRKKKDETKNENSENDHKFCF